MKKILCKFWFIVLLIIILMSIIAPVICKFNPSEVNLNQVLLKPNSIHIMGTDNVGRDIFSRILYGGRVSLSIAIFSVMISTIIGIVYGGISGYFGGIIDSFMMRILDAFLSIPSLVVMLAFQSIVRGGVLSMILIIGFTGWLKTARIVRAQFISIKNKNYVKVAKVLGTPTIKIMINHLLKNSISAILVVSILNCSEAVFMEVSMSFLGIGVKEGIPSWGNMLNNAQSDILAGAWWVALFPGLFIIVSMLSINFIGDEIKNKLSKYTL